MNLLLKYTRTHIKSVALFGLFSIIYVILFSLFDINIRVVIYSFVVCCFFGLVVAVIDFSRYVKKHNRLVLLEKEVSDTVDNLPKPWELIERDYQNIIRSLFRDKMALSYESAKKYDEMMDYYTMWVHQIKTPIAAMRLILQEEDLPANRELQDELFKIEQYVEMVLGYLRLESLDTDYVIREFDLNGIIKQAVRKYAPQFIRSKNKLVYEEKPCMVLTDYKWLSFVIEQVISNSIKYTKGGRVEIAVEEPKTLVIRDTGIGISSEDLPRIFEKGFTGYNGRLNKKSTGIGLYLCSRIMKNLGHGISVSSQVGKGTEVRLDLSCYNLQVE